uniref:Sorting nexin 24 n=1 Tax=Hippocampus comes TaxID=109280 RepID=A0A3Q2XHZ7_HIPCM
MNDGLVDCVHLKLPGSVTMQCFFFSLSCKTIIMENEVLPKIFLDFLNIRHFPSLPKTDSCGYVETEFKQQNKCFKLSHQPIMVFLNDPYLLPDAHDAFSNIVIEGVVHGVFYADLQPR